MKVSFFLLMLSVSCGTLHDNSSVIVKGNVSGLNASKLYITDAYQWDVFLDSTISQNGKFIFDLSANPRFEEPSIVSICFVDSTGRIQQLIFKNSVLSTTEKKYANSAFVVQNGTTEITGFFKPFPDNFKNPLEIKAFDETALFYKFQLTEFGFLHENDSNARAAAFSKYKQTIHKYPNSYFLLRKIVSYQEMYTTQELTEIISLFDVKLQKSKLATDLKQTIVNRNNYVFTSAQDLRLIPNSSRDENVVDTSAKLNILVFWASWCAPCRRETPDLNKLYDQYRGRGLHMSSISIDKNLDAWKKAIADDRPNWSQFLTSVDSIPYIKSRFNFSVVPTIVVTNDKGIEIKRVSGYNKQTFKEFDELIHLYLKN